MALETSFQPDLLNGVATVDVKDPMGSAPATVIRTDHAWDIDVTWSIEGFTATGYALNNDFEWKVSAYVEGIGPRLGPDAVTEEQVGADQILNFRDDHTVVGPDKYEYNTTINVAAGDLPDGAYRLVTIILARDTSVPAPLQIAAFVEGPVIQQYNPT